MNGPSTDERDFLQLAQDLERLQQITEGWSPEQRSTVTAITSTIEALQAGAFRALIKTVKEEPGGLEALKKAVSDPWVQGVLTYHGLLRAPAPTPETIVEQALESVRPMLASHNGNVELVAATQEEVSIRLEGSCDGCTFSDVTVRQGIETAIKEALPSVQRVKVVNGRPTDGLVQLKSGGGAQSGFDNSPFARPWQDAGPFDLGEAQIRAVELADLSVLLTVVKGEPKAYRNACTHLGMPLDDGEVAEGVLTCAYHGFQFLLATGECLTAPSIQLPSYPARVEDGRIKVQVAT